MSFLLDVRKINVADLMFIVKCHQQRAVADGDISHIRILDYKLMNC